MSIGGTCRQNNSHGPGELRSAGAQAGARDVAVWHLATVPVRLEDGESRLPALPAVGAAACRAQSPRGASPEEDLCGPALRGVGLADEATVELVLGRRLTEEERAFYQGGGALVTDPRLVTAGRLPLQPFNPVERSAPFPSLRTRQVAPAAGTAVSRFVPTAWVADSARGSVGVGRGQTQAAFAFATPVTPDVEQRLRYALVTRLPVASGEEFLVTHLDATRVNVFQRLLARAPLVSVALVALAALVGAVMFRRVYGRQVSVMRDLGVPGRGYGGGRPQNSPSPREWASWQASSWPSRRRGARFAGRRAPTCRSRSW